MELQQKPAVDQSLIANVTKMDTLIDYQTASIVSRTIVKKPTGTVTVFAFDKEEFLSEHTAPFDAIINILDGDAVVSIGGVDHALKTGEMVIMPANIPHAVKAVEKMKMLLIMIKD